MADLRLLLLLACVSYQAVAYVQPGAGGDVEQGPAPPPHANTPWNSPSSPPLSPNELPSNRPGSYPGETGIEIPPPSSRPCSGNCDLQCSGPGFFRHPQDCSRFIRCVDNEENPGKFQVYEFDCPAGLVFDELASTCNWPEQTAACTAGGPKPLPSPAGLSGGGDSEGLGNDYDNQGSLGGSQGPGSGTGGSFFPGTGHQPGRDHGSFPGRRGQQPQGGGGGPLSQGGSGSPSTCNPCKEAGFFRDPSSCEKFIRCVDFYGNGQFTVFNFDCPAGLVFDERYNVCNWPHEAPPCDSMASGNDCSSPAARPPAIGGPQEGQQGVQQPKQGSWQPQGPSPGAQPQQQGGWQPEQPSGQQGGWQPQQPSGPRGPSGPSGQPGPSGPQQGGWQPQQPSQPQQGGWQPQQPAGQQPNSWQPQQPSKPQQGSWQPPQPSGPRQGGGRGGGQPQQPSGPQQGGWQPQQPSQPQQGGWQPQQPSQPQQGGWQPQQPSQPQQGGWQPQQPQQPSGPQQGGWQPGGSQPLPKPQSQTAVGPPATGNSGGCNVQCASTGFFRNPSNCHKFYRCVDFYQNGQYTVFHFDCPAGLVFDERISVCNWPQNSPPCDNGGGGGGSCGSGAAPPTEDFNQGPPGDQQAPAGPSSDGQGPQQQGGAPEGPQGPGGPPKTAGPPGPAGPPSQGPPQAPPQRADCPSAGFFRNPQNCNKFYRCVDFWGNGDYTVFHFDCPGGLVFDERISVCNWPDQAPPCDSSTAPRRPPLPAAPEGPTTEAPEQAPPASTESSTEISTEMSTESSTESSTEMMSTTESDTSTTRTGKKLEPRKKKMKRIKCPGNANYEVPGDCTKFYRCGKVGPGKRAQLFQCMEGYVFDEKIQFCKKKPADFKCMTKMTDEMKEMMDEMGRAEMAPPEMYLD